MCVVKLYWWILTKAAVICNSIFDDLLTCDIGLIRSAVLFQLSILAHIRSRIIIEWCFVFQIEHLQSCNKRPALPCRPKIIISDFSSNLFKHQFMKQYFFIFSIISSIALFPSNSSVSHPDQGWITSVGRCG